MTPNSWRIVRQLELWARGEKVRLTGRCLQHVLTIKWSGDFLAVQGIGNSKIVTGMPSSNKNWKPRFFFAKRFDKDGAEASWGVPDRWRDHLTLPELPGLSDEEVFALGALRVKLQKPLEYTPPTLIPVGREVRSKRPRGEVRVSDEAPLEVMPLRAIPAEASVEETAEPPPAKTRVSKRRRLVKKAEKEGVFSEQELKSAEEESARAYEADEAARKKAMEGRQQEEDELRAALEASVLEAASFVDLEAMDSPSDQGILLPGGEGAATEEAFSVAEGVVAEAPEVGCRDGSERTVHLEASAPLPGASEQSERAEASTPPPEVEGPRHPETASPLSAEAATVAEAEAPSSPPATLPSAPFAAVGVHGSPLPERVRLARQKPSTLPPFPKPVRIPVNRQQLEARVHAAMVENAELGRVTLQSPVDLPAVGSARGEDTVRRVDLLKKIGEVREGPFESVGSQPTASGDELLAARMEVRELDKGPQLPLNRQPERRVGGPKGKTVQPGDVPYDLHAVSSLPHLSERDGRPILPGGPSYDPKDRKGSAVHLISRAEMGVMSVLVGCINEALGREVEREKEVRQESFSEGKAAAENAWFLESLRLKSEIASYRDKAHKSDTLANAAERERDARAFEAEAAQARAAEAEDRAKQAEDRAAHLEETNDHLTSFATLEAENAVRDRVDQLERRTQEAEDSARLASSARDEAVEKASLVGRQLELTEARVQALESAAKASEAEVSTLRQEVSRLNKKEEQLAGEVSFLLEKLDKADSAIQAAEVAALQEGVRADEAERIAAESSRRAKDAEAQLADARSAAALRPDVEELRSAEEEGATALKARLAEADGAQAAFSLQVEGLQRELAELRAKSEAEAKAARLREVRGNVDYFNAAVAEIQERYPELDLSSFYFARP